MKQFPFETVAYTADPAIHIMPGKNGKDECVEFVLDLPTVTFARNPLVVDYDHDTKEVVGFCALAYENGEIVGKGAFCSHVDDDRAANLGDCGEAVPYGISPTLSFDKATLEVVPEGQTGAANGREYPGPVNIYRGAEILSISVCPIPTNFQTTMTPLSQGSVVKLSRLGGIVKMANELETENKPAPIDEENVEKLGDETGVQDGAQEVRDSELQTFIDEFGTEQGVAFFQRGLTLDEAKMEDYAELKRLAKLAAEPDEAAEAQKKEDKASVEGLAALSADLQKTCAALQSLYAKLSRSPATKLGAQEPPKARPAQASTRLSYADAIINAVSPR